MDEDKVGHNSVAMQFHWHDYQKTGDKISLVYALQIADFYGHPEIAAEIERILVETFQLSGATLKTRRAQEVARLMFEVEMQKEGATKKRAYEVIGKALKREPETVRMMLQRLK